MSSVAKILKGGREASASDCLMGNPHEDSMPMSAEPRLIFATTFDLGADPHLVTIDFAVEHRDLIYRECRAAEAEARVVFVEVQESAQSREAATVGLLDLDASF